MLRDALYTIQHLLQMLQASQNLYFPVRQDLDGCNECGMVYEALCAP